MNVLIGLDDSSQAQAVMRFVLEAAWPPRTRFLVVSASPPIFLGDGNLVPPDRLSDLLREEEARHGSIAHRAATRLRRAGLVAEGRTVRGHAERVLVDTACQEETDLVIVGSHGRTGLKKLFLGSVASHVVDHAPCHVLVVKQVKPVFTKVKSREPARDRAPLPIALMGSA
jgi:nucleotide-binding universal stress UspA family protein